MLAAYNAGCPDRSVMAWCVSLLLCNLCRMMWTRSTKIRTSGPEDPSYTQQAPASSAQTVPSSSMLMRSGMSSLYLCPLLKEAVPTPDTRVYIDCHRRLDFQERMWHGLSRFLARSRRPPPLSWAAQQHALEADPAAIGKACQGSCALNQGTAPLALCLCVSQGVITAFPVPGKPKVRVTSRCSCSKVLGLEKLSLKAKRGAFLHSCCQGRKPH